MLFPKKGIQCFVQGRRFRVKPKVSVILNFIWFFHLIRQHDSNFKNSESF